MAEVLKLPKLAENDRMAEMEVWSARVATEFYAQRFFGLDRALKFPYEVVLRNDFRDTSFDHVHLFVNRWEQCLGQTPLESFGNLALCFTFGNRFALVETSLASSQS